MSARPRFLVALAFAVVAGSFAFAANALSGANSAPVGGGGGSPTSANQSEATTTCASDGAGTAAALTLNPICPALAGDVVISIINSDPHGCDITIGEATALKGCTATLYLASSAGGVITIADVANVLTLSTSPWEPAVGDNTILLYEDLANDKWQQISGGGDAATLDGLDSTEFALVDLFNVAASPPPEICCHLSFARSS